jgi:hypothetical protein
VEDHSLYRRILGDQMDRLPAPVLSFHDAPRGNRGSGTFDVTRGPGLIPRLLATVVRLPRTGTGVPVELSVEADRNQEKWIRRFDKHPMITTQWQAGDLLIEAAGPMRLGFQLTADETGLGFEMVRAWFLLIPLPRWLSPRVTAHETATDDGWFTEVQFSLPVIGLLIRYAGRIQAD